MNIGIFYFSATGITETIANHISAILEKEGNSVQQKNIITPDSRQDTIDFLEFDACIFGFPVFGGRPPTVADDWMRTLEGKNQKCSMFFTYGARDLEWAHQVTYYLLTQANFQVALSAEFIGAHSYNVGEGWSLAESRPNQLDFDVATQFTMESVKRFHGDLLFDINLSEFVYEPRETEELYGPSALFYPFREQGECSMCYLCENECPVKAFNANSGEPNRKLCIRCMHCVTICPDKVLQIGDLSQLFKEHFIDKRGLTEDVVEKKRSRIVFGKD
jgi:flavodoxin/NAD-dependent dihydropyrimidine dehydrogenase PreA subunit